MYGLASPDLVGSSEYRAIYDTVADLVASFGEEEHFRDYGEEMDDLVIACLEEFVGTARSMLRDVRRNIRGAR